MPNINSPFGLRPIRHYAGGLVRTNAYQLAPALAENIGRGDLVKSTGTNKRVSKCAAADRAVGVVSGFEFTDIDGTPRWTPNWVSGTVTKTGSIITVHVYDDPNILYEVQASGDFTVADIGDAADIVVGAPSTVSGQSSSALDVATFAAGVQLKIIDVIDAPDNEVGTYARLAVLISLHELAGARTAV